MSYITHIPIKQEIVSAKQFLENVRSDRGNIESVKFIAPRLGDGSFGKYLVTYRFSKLARANI